MQRVVIVLALAWPLCAHAVGPSQEAEFNARIERRAVQVHLTADAVKCGLRTVDWAVKSFNWIYAGGVVDVAELFPSGKSRDSRTIVAHRRGNRLVFRYGFAKNEMDNIARNDQAAPGKLGEKNPEHDETTIGKMVAAKLLVEVGDEPDTYWEQGTKKPSGPAVKLLDLVERKGLEVLLA